MSKREKIMLYVTILLTVVLVGKSLFFDEVKVSGDELKVKKFVELAVKENPKYNNFFARKNIVTYKVTSISKVSEEGTSHIGYMGNDKYIEADVDGKYRVKVTGYFLRILPFKKFSVESNTES
ncbi:hypothetical protein [Anaeromicrobium sediminis]|uniref:Uncharacterized protein n=1 Tax=Anaeromicrobium sediminis TaxID=1478221 RepID=A0A267MFH9_9FIRM|nr:hypothetical protein [Anaeromicrobium sediminis]PAB57560.1 hypothetical protein CCE28_18840 [Anaeromicrobium sediminis]